MNAPDVSAGAAQNGAVSRAALVSRLWHTAMLQVDDIEQRLGDEARQPAERERDARTMSALVRILRDLNDIDAKDGGEPAHDDHGPRDIEDFRRDLARRMDEIAARRTDGAGHEPDGA